MKLFRNSILFILGLIFLMSCGSQKAIPSFETYLYPNGQILTDRSLDNLDTRKFDFYFFEAIRLLMLEDYHNAVLFFHEAIKIDSTCATCYSELGRMMINADDIAQAEQFFLKAVQIDPTNEYFVDVLSNIYVHQKKDTLAFQATQFLSNSFPDNITYLYRLVATQIELGEYKSALTTLDLIEKREGNHIYVMLSRIEIFEELNKLNKAEATFLDLIQAHPSNSEYKVSLGDFYFSHKKNKKALAAYNRVVSEDSLNGIVHFKLANYYHFSGDSALFKSHLIKGLLHENVDEEFKLRELYAFVEDPTIFPFTQLEFYSLVDEITKIHPYSTQLLNFYAVFGKEVIGKEAAAKAFETSLLLDENQLDVWHEYFSNVYWSGDSTNFYKYFPVAIKLFPTDPLLNFFGGISAFSDKKYDSAVNFLLKATKQAGLRDAFYSNVYSLLGDVYFKLKDFQAAYENYENSLKYDINNVTVLNNYAYYLSVNSHDLAKAESMINRVIELEPLNPTFLDTYAWILFKRGKYLDALFVIEQVIELEKDPSGVLYEHYGDILYMNDQINDAVDYWIKASETDDEDLTDALQQKIKEKKYYE